MEDKDSLKELSLLEEKFEIARIATKYRDDFEKIANHPIYEKLTVRGVKLSHKTIKRAYKEMEYIKFRGDIIDYLCYTALHHVLSVSIIMEIISVSGSNTNSALKMMRSLFDEWTIYTVLSCRLILKDETYLDDFFNHFEVKKGKFYDGVKESIYKKINKYLKVEPKQPNKSKTLKRS